MIKHFSFAHGQYYHYRYHLTNLNSLNNGFSTLKNYLETIHKTCPFETLEPTSTNGGESGLGDP